MLAAIDGYKTYIVCAVGILVVVVNHFLGPVPGVNLDPMNWLTDVWNMVLLMTGRHAIAKMSAPTK